ncbi:MAG: acetyl-CoA carboxylase carboxyl transferase subunit alpha, partial [Vicingaceae bacterium]
KLTSTDMKKLGIVDDIIKEPLNGAHRDHDETFKTVKISIAKYLTELKAIKPEDRINNRIEAFSNRGVWK